MRSDIERDGMIKRGPGGTSLCFWARVTGAGQIILVRLTASNSIDITEAIWFSAGRWLPALRNSG
jgi:hypothetical protein